LFDFIFLWGKVNSVNPVVAALLRLCLLLAGAVVEDDAKDLAHENGMYVIVQSGKAVEIVTPPEGFRAKEW
jgi:hypothetical protein